MWHSNHKTPGMLWHVYGCHLNFLLTNYQYSGRCHENITLDAQVLQHSKEIAYNLYDLPPSHCEYTCVRAGVLKRKCGISIPCSQKITRIQGTSQSPPKCSLALSSAAMAMCRYRPVPSDVRTTRGNRAGFPDSRNPCVSGIIASLRQKYATCPQQQPARVLVPVVVGHSATIVFTHTIYIHTNKHLSICTSLSRSFT